MPVFLDPQVLNHQTQNEPPALVSYEELRQPESDITKIFALRRLFDSPELDVAAIARQAESIAPEAAKEHWTLLEPLREPLNELLRAHNGTVSYVAVQRALYALHGAPPSADYARMMAAPDRLSLLAEEPDPTKILILLELYREREGANLLLDKPSAEPCGEANPHSALTIAERAYGPFAIEAARRFVAVADALDKKEDAAPERSFLFSYLSKLEDDRALLRVDYETQQRGFLSVAELMLRENKKNVPGGERTDAGEQRLEFPCSVTVLEGIAEVLKKSPSDSITAHRQKVVSDLLARARCPLPVHSAEMAQMQPSAHRAVDSR